MPRRALSLCHAAIASFVLTTCAAAAQNSEAPVEKPAAPKAIKLGEVLRGQLNAIRSRGKKGKGAMPTFQLVSEPRRLPPPGDLCNLETGPETFQITANDAQAAAQLKPLIGKNVALKIDGITCAEEAGVMSEAVVTKWSLVKDR